MRTMAMRMPPKTLTQRGVRYSDGEVESGLPLAIDIILLAR